MGLEGFQRHFLGDLLAVLRGSQHGDDVAVGHGGMNQNAGGIHMGHDGHEVHRLVGGGLLHLQGVGQAPMVIAGVSHTADDGDGNMAVFVYYNKLFLGL